MLNNFSTAEYKCDPGYELFYGNSRRFCNIAIMEWSGIEPICESDLKFINKFLISTKIINFKFQEVFECPANHFNFGYKCLKFFEVSFSSQTYSYQNANNFCKSNEMQLLISNNYYDLRNEIAFRMQFPLVLIINSTNLLQSNSNALCFNVTSDSFKLTECKKTFTVICTVNRGSLKLSFYFFTKK